MSLATAGRLSQALHCRGHIDDDKLWLPAEKVYDAALRNAADYERYNVAASLLRHAIARAKALPSGRPCSLA